MSEFQNEQGEHRKALEASWQSMQRIIEEIPGREKYAQAREKEGFTAVHIQNAGPEENQRTAEEIRAYLLHFFSEEETDSTEDYITAIEEHLGDFFAIRNRDGEMIAFMNSQRAEIKGKGEELIIWYVVTSEEHRGKGLASELYRQAYHVALRDIRKEQKRMVAIVGETEGDAETFFNSMGRRRLYYKDRDGAMHEVPYAAPATNPDEEPTPEEHFMARLIDGEKKIPINDAEKLIGNVLDQYEHPQYFKGMSEAFKEEYLGTIAAIRISVQTALESSSDEVIYLYTKQERDSLKATGVQFV